jgi:hypothetical protein
MELLLILCIVIAAAVLSVAQAWAVDGSPSRSRYAVAWGVSTRAFLAPTGFIFGLPGGVDAGRNQVSWTAIGLTVATTTAALAIASWVRSPAALGSLSMSQRVLRLYPIHLILLVVFGAAAWLILSLVILSNIH